MFGNRVLNCGLVFLIALFTLLALGEVAADDCPANEFYTDCGGSCQTECATLNEPCRIQHFRCPSGCYCNEGFARDGSGKCIPINKCHKKKHGKGHN